MTYFPQLDDEERRTRILKMRAETPLSERSYRIRAAALRRDAEEAEYLATSSKRNGYACDVLPGDRVLSVDEQPVESLVLDVYAHNGTRCRLVIVTTDGTITLRWDDPVTYRRSVHSPAFHEELSPWSALISNDDDFAALIAAAVAAKSTKRTEPAVIRPWATCTPCDSGAGCELHRTPSIDWQLRHAS